MTARYFEVLPHPAEYRARTLTLTAKGRAALAEDQRLIPADLFSQAQYDAIRAAGLDVFFVRAERLLGGAR